MYLPRKLELASILEHRSCFLFGPRQSGKTQLARHDFGHAYFVDLLDSDVYRTISFRPSYLRQTVPENTAVVVIDEIQKIPELLDEVHLMIERSGLRFLLTGSSARKLWD